MEGVHHYERSEFGDGEEREKVEKVVAQARERLRGSFTEPSGLDDILGLVNGIIQHFQDKKLQVLKW